MISTRFLNLVLVLASIIVYVNCQTCDNASPYSWCSINGNCGCLPLSFSNNFGICGRTDYNCAQFSRCQAPNEVCPSDHICVRHSRCDSQPLCFPLSMTGEQACPTFEVTTDSLFVISNVISNYSSALNNADGLYSRPGGSSNTYYEAIQLYVPTSGYYNISSLGNMDTHGYLYNGTFYPSNPQINQIAHDDDGNGNGQFKLPVFLQAGVPYTLVVTTHNSLATGPFSVVASGPDNIYFTPINPITTTTTTLPPIVSWSFSNSLSSSNPTFDRTGNSSAIYYYRAYQVRVNRTGNYTFKCSSGFDTYGYIYQGNFYPGYPNFNIHQQDDDKGGSSQFSVSAELRSDITYILVVTSFSPITTGTFSITASGPEYADVVLIQ